MNKPRRPAPGSLGCSGEVVGSEMMDGGDVSWLTPTSRLHLAAEEHKRSAWLRESSSNHVLCMS
jgi:hypothetical protein